MKSQIRRMLIQLVDYSLTQHDKHGRDFILI